MARADGRDGFWNKAIENLDSARSELAADRYNACANRAYYTTFQAAIAALLDFGLTPRVAVWGHGFVQAQFAGQLIARRKLYSAALRDTLSSSLELRSKADFESDAVSQREAVRAVRRVEVFLAVITERRGDHS